MKLGVLLIVGLLLLIPIVSAMDFTCVKKEDCSLYTGNDYDCLNGQCVSGVVEKTNFLDVSSFILNKDELKWGVIEVKVEKASYSICSNENCINFAPVKENIVLKIISWIIYGRG